MGRWLDAAPGVVGIPGAPASWESRLVAATLSVDGRAVASRLTAAQLHRLDGFDDDVVEFTALHGKYNGAQGLLVHRTRRLDPVDVQFIRRPAPRTARRFEHLGLVTGFRTTTASRTIVDLAASLGADRLGLAIDSAARLGLSSPAYLLRRMTDLRAPGRAGIRLLDAVMLDSGGHSWLERRYLQLMRLAGLPRPVCQAVHRRAGAFVARVDFDYRPLPLVVEVAGRQGHSSDADRAKDARRRNELGSLGVHVLDFVTTQIIEQPQYVVDTVRERICLLTLGTDSHHP